MFVADVTDATADAATSSRRTACGIEHQLPHQPDRDGNRDQRDRRDLCRAGGHRGADPGAEQLFPLVRFCISGRHDDRSLHRDRCRTGDGIMLVQRHRRTTNASVGANAVSRVW